MKCASCRAELDDRVDVRYTMGGKTLCSPECVVAERVRTGSW